MLRDAGSVCRRLRTVKRIAAFIQATFSSCELLCVPVFGFPSGAGLSLFSFYVLVSLPSVCCPLVARVGFGSESSSEPGYARSAFLVLSARSAINSNGTMQLAVLGCFKGTTTIWNRR